MEARDFRRTAREAVRGKWKLALPLFLLAALLLQRLGVAQLRAALAPHVTLDPQMDVQEILLLPAWVNAVLLALELALGVVAGWIRLGMYGVSGELLEGRTPTLRTLFPGKRLGAGLLMGVLLTAVNRGTALLAQLTRRMEGNPGLILLFIAALAAAGLAVWLLIRLDMTYYLLARHPGMRLFAALGESFRRMRGNVARAIRLTLSLMGWGLLSVVAQNLLLRAAALLPGIGQAAAQLVIAVALNAPLQLYIFTSFAALYRWVEADGGED